MPLVKINLLEGRTAQEKGAIAASIQAALVSILGVPDEDRYQLFSEYDTEDFRHTSTYLGLEYTDQLLIIEITFVVGRDDEKKKALLAAITANLVASGVVGADDVFVMITEIGLANVSFGQGLAQRAPTRSSSTRTTSGPGLPSGFPFALAGQANGTCFISGMPALGPDGTYQEGTFIEEVALAWKNVTAIAEASGFTADEIVYLQCVVADIGDYAELNEWWRGQFPDAATAPARFTFQAGALPFGCKIELQAVAAHA